MAPLHELTNMQVNRGNARQGLDRPRGGGAKDPSDPSTGMSLHGLKCFHGAFKTATLIVPQLSTICSDQEDTRMVEKPFVLGAESTDRVPQGHHSLHRGEGLGGITSQVLLEGERLIEEEAQVPPVGIGMKRQVPSEGGIAKINRRVVVPTLPGKMEDRSEERRVGKECA